MILKDIINFYPRLIFIGQTGGVILQTQIKGCLQQDVFPGSRART